jgi:hypothetical protein
MAIEIREGGLEDSRVAELLAKHVARARGKTARGSAHGLDVSGLKGAGICFWVAWKGEEVGLGGCGLSWCGDLSEGGPGGDEGWVVVAEAGEDECRGVAPQRLLGAGGNLTIAAIGWRVFDPELAAADSGTHAGVR